MGQRAVGPSESVGALQLADALAIIGGSEVGAAAAVRLRVAVLALPDSPRRSALASVAARLGCLPIVACHPLEVLWLVEDPRVELVLLAVCARMANGVGAELLRVVIADHAAVAGMVFADEAPAEVPPGGTLRLRDRRKA